MAQIISSQRNFLKEEVEKIEKRFDYAEKTEKALMQLFAFVSLVSLIWGFFIVRGFVGKVSMLRLWIGIIRLGGLAAVSFISGIYFRQIKRIKAKTKKMLSEKEGELEAELIAKNYFEKYLADDYCILYGLLTDFGYLNFAIVGKTGVFAISVKENKEMFPDQKDAFREYESKTLLKCRAVNGLIPEEALSGCIIVFPFATVNAVHREINGFDLYAASLDDVIRFVYRQKTKLLNRRQSEEICKTLSALLY